MFLNPLLLVIIILDLIFHRGLVVFLFVVNAMQAAAVVYMSWFVSGSQSDILILTLPRLYCVT